MNLQIRRKGRRGRVADPSMPELFCRLPFTEVSVSEDGSVYPNCCPDWVEFPLGNLFKQSWDDVWNGKQAQLLRQSMLDGDLRYCDHHWCPHIQSARQGHADPHVVPRDEAGSVPLPPGALAGEVRISEGPTNVSMNYDSSCNLACPTCRPEIRQVRGKAADRMATLHRVVEDELLVGAHTVSMTGTGDPFASKFLREFLTDFSAETHPGIKRVYLYTNAIMWTQAMWQRLPGLHDIDLAADISIDAATAATYESVRRPARWDQLQENLAFIATIPNLRELGVNMTISRPNFREVRAFYDLASDLADRRDGARTFVEFKRVRRWGSHTDAQWAEHDLERLAPDELAELVEQLRAIEALRSEPRTGRSHLDIRSNLGDFLSADA
jgi:MoaA/NifB/PqqE/SkfB family radical SAM enzyme